VIAQVRDRSRRLDCMAMRPIVATAEPSRSLTAEPQLVDLLDELATFGVVTFHDRRIRRSLCFIDHVVVAPSGVYAVDARPWSRHVEMRERGHWLQRSERLMVGSRDRTRLANGVVKKASLLRGALRGFQIPVHPVLCFTDGDWPVWARPIEIRGATVMWPMELERRAKQLGRVNPQGLVALAAVLEASLPRR
jgi:nuclease-like protein